MIAAGALIVSMLAGCGSLPTPQSAASASGDSAPGVQPERTIVREPDAPPRERWAAPFAVQSSGRVEPLLPREVVIVDAAPSIAEGLELQRAQGVGRSNPVARPVDPSDGADPSNPELGTRRLVHRVGPGETLSAIADRYGVSSEAIARANDLEDELLAVGRELIIPPPGD